MTDPTLDLDAIERILSMARQDRIPYTAQILDTADALVAEVHRLRAQREDIKQSLRFGAYDAAVSYLTGHVTVGCACDECAALRAALGVQPEHSNNNQEGVDSDG
jgi:hypothetical protein